MSHIVIDNISSIYTYKTERDYWECPKERNVYILSYQVSGHYDHDFSGKILPVKADTLFFIDKSDTYKVERKEHGHSLCVIFTADTDLKTQILDCSSDPRFLNLFMKLKKCSALQIKSVYFRAMAIIYEIISLMEEKSQQIYLTNTTKLKISGAHSYISEHFTEEINLSDLAENIGISTKHFRTLFKKSYGMPPNQYIIALRLNMAVSLISQGNLTISEISALCGFSDVYYFSRLFKKHFSKSPKTFKIAESHRTDK